MRSDFSLNNKMGRAKLHTLLSKVLDDSPVILSTSTVRTDGKFGALCFVQDRAVLRRLDAFRFFSNPIRALLYADNLC